MDPFTIFVTVVSIVSGVASYQQAKKIQKKLDRESRGVEANIESNIKAIPVVYGERRVGGVRVFIDTSKDINNQYLYMVMAMAEGEVEDIHSIEIDGVSIDDDKFIQSGLGANFIYEKFLGGDDQTASDLIIDGVAYSTAAEVPPEVAIYLANQPNNKPWNENHKLQGVAYLAMKMLWDPNAYSGVPDITAIVKGKKVYDPRYPSAAKAWSSNPALCIRDYLTNTRYGKGIPESAINDTMFSQAANDYDAFTVTPYEGADDITLFEVNTVVDTEVEIIKNLNDMLMACRGFLPYVDGKYGIRVDQATNHVMEVGSDQIIDGISIVGTKKEDRFNQVKVNFFNKDKQYKEDTAVYPDVDDPTDVNNLYQQLLAEDGGEPLVDDIKIDGINNYYTAREMAKLFLLRSRLGTAIGFRATSELMELEVGDTFLITQSTPEWTNKKFQVQEISLNFDGTVNIQAIEYSESIYTYNEASEETPFVSTKLPDPNKIAPVTDLSASAGTEISADGKTISFIDLSWTAPNDALVDRYEVKYTIDDESVIYSAVAIDPTHRIVDAEGSYDISVYAVNGFGAKSTGVTLSDVVAVADTSAPSNITGVSISSALQSISLKWTNPTEDDFDLVRIKVADTNAEPTTHSFEVRSDSFVHDIGAYSTTKYYWLAPVDRTGNVGNYVSGGTATTGSIAIGDVPAVAGTFYLTLGNNDAPTNAEFLTAIGRNPIEGDVVVVNKAYFFTRGASAWSSVTEFIDGSLLVTDSITATSLSTISADLGAITGGSLQGSTTTPIPDANSAPSGDEVGAFIDLSDGKFVFGNASEYVLWDGTNLTGTFSAVSSTSTGEFRHGGNLVVDGSGHLYADGAIKDVLNPTTRIVFDEELITFQANDINLSRGGLNIAGTTVIGDDRSIQNTKSVELDAQTTAPTVTTNKMYDISGTLYYNGSAVGGGSNDYADSFSVNNTTGVLTIGRTGSLADLTADISTYVGNQVSALVDSAPTTLDTLNELASALGDDPNFATTVSTSLGNKANKAGDTFTGTMTQSYDSTVWSHSEATHRPLSKKIYSETGLSNATTGASITDVYGESDLSAIDNDETFAYADAWDAVESHGGRLPTLAEVMDGVGQGSGQGYDDKYIWTCTPAGAHHVWVVKGNYGAYPDKKIVDINDSLEVYRTRCFFDVSRDGRQVHYSHDGNIYIQNAEVTSSKISNWDTAYGWGDHSTQGYLTAGVESNLNMNLYDIIAVNDLDAEGVIRADTGYKVGTTTVIDASRNASFVNGSFVGDLDVVTGGASGQIRVGRTVDQNLLINVNDRTALIEHRQDEGTGEHIMQFNINSPTALANKSFNFTNGNIKVGGTTVIDSSRNISNVGTISASGVITALEGNSNEWNDAFTWGDHASAGYLTSYTETDTLASVMARGDSTANTIVITSVGSNVQAPSNGIRVSGYGITGNRGTFYVTGTNTVQIGVGGTHNANPAMEFTSSHSKSFHTLYENSNRVFTDAYHPNADKWTTPRTNTVTLTGDATGSGSASVDGSGNWTVSVPVTVANDSHTHDGRYVNVTGDTMTGDLKFTNNNAVYFERSNIGGFIPYPGGAQFATSSSSLTGAIKIQLPVHGAADMVSFWVDVYHYSTNKSFSVFVSGYVYQTTGGNEWHNLTTWINSYDTGEDFTLRFGADGSKNCMWIGETNSNWSYPQVTVRDLQVGYSADVDAWKDAWNISFVTSFDTVDETRTNNHGYARHAKQADKWTTARTLSLTGDVTGSTSWDGSGNASITATVANDSHTHDGRYYTESEADSRFANITGDTFTGNLAISTASPRLTLTDTTDSDDHFISFRNSSSELHSITTTGSRLNINSAQDIKINRNGTKILDVVSTGLNVTGNVVLSNNGWYYSQYSASDDQVRFNANNGGGLDIYNQTQGAFANVRAGSFNVGTTNVIDSSRNLTNIGNITSSGTISGTDLVATNKTYIGSDNDFLRVGGGGGGKSGVFGNRMNQTGGGLDYGAYISYDSYWNGTEWIANRTTLSRKWMTHIGGYHDNSFHINYYGGSASSGWSDSSWTRLLTIESSGNTVFSGDLFIDKGTPRVNFKSNESGSDTGGRIELNENGNFWVNAQGGRDLWLNWVAPNSASSKADLNIGDGDSGSYIFRVEGSTRNVQVNGATIIDASRNASFESLSIGTVGGIKQSNGEFGIGSGSHGVHFNNSGANILPYSYSTNAWTNGVTDFGHASYRYKDGFFNGKISVNTLEVFGNSIKFANLNDSLTFEDSGNVYSFNTDGGAGNAPVRAGSYQVGTTTVIDSSRNITCTNLTPTPSGGSVVGGGRFLTPFYTSGHNLPVFSTQYSSGSLLIGYGVEGDTATTGYKSTYSNFTGHRAAIKVNSDGINILGTTIATNAPVGSTISLEESFSVSTSTKITKIHELLLDTGANYRDTLFTQTGALGNGTLEIMPNTMPGSGTANYYTHFKNNGIVGSGGATRHSVRIDGVLQVGGTTVIDSSRNLTNIANITATGLLSVNKIYTAISLPNGGAICRGGTTTATSDLGLYSYVSGNWIRIVTNNAPINFFSDGGTNGRGTIINVSFDTSGNITARGNVTAYSDARLKDNVKTLDGSKVYEMRGVSFTKDGELGSGVIAQELEQVAPELVMTNDDEMQTKSVAYGNVVGYLIEAIKELKQEIEVLKNGTNSN